MGPADDGSGKDSGSGIRKTDGWRQDVPFQEIAARLNTTTDPLLTEMFNLGLRYDQGQFYQRQEGSQEREMSKDEAFALLRPRFPGSGAADESGDSTIPIDDDAIESAIESAEPAPSRGPPSAPPFRRERPAEPEEPSVRVSETYAGQMDQRARLNKLEELHLALLGNNPEELIRKALTDYLTLVPTNEKPDEDDLINFFHDAVPARGREIIGHYTSQLELLLEQAPEAAGHFAVEAASSLYFDLPMASVEKFVKEGLQAADKVGYFSIEGDAGKRAFENLFIDEHERLVRGEAAAREANLKRSVAVADALLNGERKASPPLAGPPGDGTVKPSRGGLFGPGGPFGSHYDWRKGFFILSAGAAALSMWAAYLHMDRNTYRKGHGALQQQQTELQGQHKGLTESYDELSRRAKAIQEGPQGQAWTKREEELQGKQADLERRANDAERDSAQWMKAHADLKREYDRFKAQRPGVTTTPAPAVLSWGEKIKASINDPVQLYSLVEEALAREAGPVYVLGGDCNRYLGDLYEKVVQGPTDLQDNFVWTLKKTCNDKKVQAGTYTTTGKIRLK